MVRDSDGGHRIRYGLYQRLLQREPEIDAPARPRRLFYCCAAEDEALLVRLDKHLKLLQRQGLIETWHHRQIPAGEDWRKTADARFDEAEVILLLVSADFLSSDHAWDVEVTGALARHEQGTAVVIPVLLRPCDWKSAAFAKLRALPANETPVTRWVDQDEAWVEIALGLRHTLAGGRS